MGLTALPAAAVVNPDGSVTVDVLAFNDFHGRIEEGGQSAGAAVLAGAADTLRAENPDTVLVSAGDNIGASTFTSMVQDDEPTIEALNLMDLFASAVGNHEFDKGAADLSGRVSDLATFPYLGANITPRPANVDEYAVWDSPSGVTVGFVGVVTPEVPSLVTPAGIEGLTFGSMVESANRVAAQLSDGDTTNGEADVVVVLAHDGAATPELADATGATAFGDLVNGAGADIDAIVSGHTHVLYEHDIDGMLVTQASQYGEYLTKLSFTVDPATGDVTASSSEQLDLVGGATQFPADAEIAELVAAAAAEAEVLGAVPLGEITDDFNRARQSGGGENRGGESTLGNFVADVQLWATQELGTQIAFMNPGGLRADLTYAASGEEGDGVVTYKEAAVVQPFANTLWTMDLTGAQIVQVLEEQWQPESASRPFLKLGVSDGLQYTYDPTAEAGSHITAVTLNGEPLDPAGTYKVVVNAFLASGGDNFVTLADGANAADSGRIDLQAMVDYLGAITEPASPDLAQRAVGVDVEGDLFPGTFVTVNLSSLAFSTNEPKPSEASIALDGTVLATAPVDTSIVDTTDEVGRASLRFEVPADLGLGTHEFTVTAGPTVITVPLTASATTRYAGVDRYAVAANVSARNFEPGAPVVYLANGLAYADALAGVPVAGADGAPLLLTRPGALPDATRAELERLDPQHVVILGGPGSVSSEVFFEVAAMSSVERWSGIDRYDVAAGITAENFAAGVETLYVAAGLAPADALTGATLAGRDGAPLLLVRQTEIPAVVAAEIDRLDPERIVILGGAGTVSGQVEGMLSGYASVVTRYSGADRYEVAATVSRHNYGDSALVYVAGGLAWADALAGAPVAAADGAPMLLVRPDSVPPVTGAEIDRLGAEAVAVLGGPGSVSTAVETVLAGMVQPQLG